MAHHYIAQFLPQEDGTFCVFFPDLEGCNTFGDTLQEAFEAAQDAATGWLEVEADRGTPLPAPSSLAAAKAKRTAANLKSTSRKAPCTSSSPSTPSRKSPCA